MTAPPPSQWAEWLATDLSLCHVPRAARVCFTLFGRPLSSRGGTAVCSNVGIPISSPELTRSASSQVPLGWVSMQLFDHKDRLASGVRPLRLWPGGVEANPIGCNVENVTVFGADTPTLYVEFEAFSTPLLLPADGAAAAAGDAAADPSRRIRHAHEKGPVPTAEEVRGSSRGWPFSHLLPPSTTFYHRWCSSSG